LIGFFRKNISGMVVILGVTDYFSQKVHENPKWGE